ncbi:MAG: hypothetical protein P8R37_04385 [Opitutae bacterium]|nr:hypothetical protein [Opitutae bacterium]MDG1300805.1 hypothetical protein [Opitutae bacterium]
MPYSRRDVKVQIKAINISEISSLTSNPVTVAICNVPLTETFNFLEIF